MTKNLFYLYVLVNILKTQGTCKTIYHLQSDRDSIGASTWVDFDTVTVSGIVTANYGVTGSRNFFLEMSQGGPWSGIKVYIPSSKGDFTVSVGDSLTVTGSALEYCGYTELIVSDATNIVGNGTTTVPAPAIISAAHIDTSATSSFGYDSAEAYEGELVKIQNALIIDTTAPHGDFQITDGDGHGIVYNFHTYTPHIGDSLNIAEVIYTHYGLQKIRLQDIEDISLIVVFDTLKIKFQYGFPETAVKTPIILKNIDWIEDFHYSSRKVHYKSLDIDSSIRNFNLRHNVSENTLRLAIASLVGDSVKPGIDTSTVSNRDSTHIEDKGLVTVNPHSNFIDVSTKECWIYFTDTKGDSNEDNVVNIVDVARVISIIIGERPIPVYFEQWAAYINDNVFIYAVGMINIINSSITFKKILSVHNILAVNYRYSYENCETMENNKRIVCFSNFYQVYERLDFDMFKWIIEKGGV